MVKAVFEGILVSESAPGPGVTEPRTNTVPVAAPAGVQTTMTSVTVPGTPATPVAAFCPVLNRGTIVWNARFMDAIGVKHAYLIFAKHPHE